MLHFCADAILVNTTQGPCWPVEHGKPLFAMFSGVRMMLNKDLDRTLPSRPETASDKPTKGHLHPRADAHSYSRKFGPGWAWRSLLFCAQDSWLCVQGSPLALCSDITSASVFGVSLCSGIIPSRTQGTVSSEKLWNVRAGGRGRHLPGPQRWLWKFWSPALLEIVSCP